MTARWVVDEVAPARDLSITWQPISLHVKNTPDEGSREFGYTKFSHDLLRVMESVRSTDGDDAVFALYWEYGRRIHHDRDRAFTASDALEATGFDLAHAAAADDARWDDELRRRMDKGLALVGDDVGTPIIAFEDSSGSMQGIFGPVITRVPPTADSLAMWDAMVALMGVDGFWELKRTRTERPDFGPRP